MKYLTARDLDDATRLREQTGYPALAGGTDLYPASENGVAVAGDLGLRGDEDSEEGNESFAPLGGRIAPILLLQALDVGYGAVFLVHEGCVGTLEDLLPAQAVGHDEDYFFCFRPGLGLGCGEAGEGKSKGKGGKTRGSHSGKISWGLFQLSLIPVSVC